MGKQRHVSVKIFVEAFSCQALWPHPPRKQATLVFPGSAAAGKLRALIAHYIHHQSPIGEVAKLILRMPQRTAVTQY